MSKEVVVYMNAVPSNYQIDWNKPKEAFPRVSADCFVDLSREDRKFPNYSWPWSERLEVEDSSDEQLPETLFLVILLSGCYFSEHTWKNSYGGSSWYPHKVFVSRETALESIRDKDREWERYWVVPIRSFH